MSEIIDNYKALAEERGWDDETMAANIEQVDPALAAEYREAAGAPAPVEATPEPAQSVRDVPTPVVAEPAPADPLDTPSV